MSLHNSTQFEASDAAQDFSTIGNRLVQLDALLDAIRVVVAEVSLYEGQVEELIDVAKHLLHGADTAFCNYNEWQSKSIYAAVIRTQVAKVNEP